MGEGKSVSTPLPPLPPLLPDGLQERENEGQEEGDLTSLPLPAELPVAQGEEEGVRKPTHASHSLITLLLHWDCP